VSLERVAAGFNIDAMNVYGRVQHLGIIGFGQSYLDELLTAAAARQGRSVTPDENPAAGSYFRSDHFPLAKRGVPMAYAEGGGDFRDGPTADREALRAEYGTRRYHQADDEIQPGWDLRGMIEDLEVIYAIGLDLANSRAWPEWKPTSEFRHIRESSDAVRR
jgi:Predicted aminopeptidases